MEFTLLWAAFAGVGSVYGALWWMGRRDPSICVRDLWEIALGAGVAGLVVGRLVAMVSDGVNPVANPADILLVRAGVDTTAAAIAALVTAGWLARPNLADQLDGLAPAAVLGIAGWHAGCLLRDACLGTPTSLPWGWSQPGSDITRHPVELYAVVALAVSAVALFRLRLRYPPAFLVSSLAVAAVGFVRLATEPLRPALFAGPVWWYGLAAAGGLAGAVWAIRAGRTDADQGSLQ